MQRVVRQTSPTGVAPRLLSKRETAELFGVSRNLLATHPELPCYRIGKHLRYDPAELKEFFRQQALPRSR